MKTIWRMVNVTKRMACRESLFFKFTCDKL